LQLPQFPLMIEFESLLLRYIPSDPQYLILLANTIEYASLLLANCPASLINPLHFTAEILQVNLTNVAFLRTITFSTIFSELFQTD
jgi:hypothetical protein